MKTSQLNGSESLTPNEYEYAFEAVPASGRKTLLSLFFVLAGYAIALTNFVSGGVVAVGMTFKDALIAIFIGNIVLIGIVITTGIISQQYGLSSSFLSRKAFGKKGSSIFSIMIALSSVTWVAINGDMFARLIKSTFTWWPIPIPLTAILVIFMWLMSAIKGYKGLEFISFIGVPAAIVISLVGVIATGNVTGGYTGLFDFIPSQPITFTAATASIIGSWIFGASMSPDICRYAKKKSHVVISAIGAFFIGCIGLEVAGAMLAITTGEGDFIVSMTTLGLAGLAFVCAIFCLWTTQDNSIFSASLALQNVLRETSLSGKVKHSTLAIGIAAMSAIFGALGIYSFILPIVQTFSVVVVPIPALIITECLYIKNSKEHKDLNILSMISWIVGIIAGYWSLNNDIFISAIIGMVATAIVYVILSRLFDTNLNSLDR